MYEKKRRLGWHPFEWVYKDFLDHPSFEFFHGDLKSNEISITPGIFAFNYTCFPIIHEKQKWRVVETWKRFFV